ncbi:hypothetical protein MMC13_001739 [Lambiella insularis]|nr:hypothetical protein [Lambiella insularis]
MKALGLAGFVSTSYTPSVMIQARAQYTAPINLVNAALKSPVDVKKDSTLLAILVLAAFETVTGAAALLQVRGRERLSDTGGRRLFVQVIVSLAATCLRHSLEVPEHILKLWLEGKKYVEDDDPAWLYYEYMILATNLLARVRRGAILDLSFIITRAQELDAEFASIFANVPPIWTYRVIATDADPDIVFTGYYHIYNDFMSAFTWNNDSLYNRLSHRFLWSDFTSWRPYLGDTNVLMVRTSEGYSLDVAPLLAGAMSISTEQTRQWVAATLRSISYSMGIQQGLVVTKLLEQRIKVWEENMLKQPRLAPAFPENYVASGSDREVWQTPIGRLEDSGLVLEIHKQSTACWKTRGLSST